MAESYRIGDVAGKGRGCLAAHALCAGDLVMTSRPFLAVLYTDFAATNCARCYLPAQDLCQRCQRFVLCAKCEGAALREFHATECDWYCAIPAAMRSGDTDYLRFVLRYFNVLLNGWQPERPECLAEMGEQATVAEYLSQLRGHRDEQPASFLSWANKFAVLFTQFVTLPAPVGGTEGLVELFCRIRTNSLGYPFSTEQTMGWSLHSISRASGFNHSCDPNCRMTPGPEGSLVVRTLRDVQPEEELTISYVDLQTPEYNDAEARREHLLDTFRFACCCPRCVRELDLPQPAC
eukprot:TRINITY_DN54741_c0_g1_i1.p1 TRINITY_DN54741_c0_g1~~TRINITY_DN54741_c0_g1_i1.p1  ORF type:complete len:292 (+),score=20.41 TRINITY_DN54741_c0_g1_i1:59-934(+)